MESSVNEDLTLRFALLGDNAVGKTLISQRFSTGTYGEGNKNQYAPKCVFIEKRYVVYNQTFGLDVYQKKVQLTADISVNIQIWDIGGQAIKNRLIQNVLLSVDVILFVYDITNIGTFIKLEEWITLVYRAYFGNADQDLTDPKDSRLPYMALLGNKCKACSMHIKKLNLTKI
jgi:GTPase SAR1 family protein